MSDLLNCPHCDGLANDHVHRSKHGTPVGHVVSCAGCGAEAGVRPSLDEATAAWNRRTAAAVPGDCVVVPMLSPDDMRELAQFESYCEDGQDYGNSLTAMARLAELGAVERIRGKMFRTTSFGDYLLSREPQLPLRTSEEQNALWEREHQEKLAMLAAAEGKS